METAELKKEVVNALERYVSRLKAIEKEGEELLKQEDLEEIDRIKKIIAKIA